MPAKSQQYKKLVANKRQIAHEEAPSGFVTLYNYKEPFMKFEGGFGYQGVLLFDGKTDKVQCHLCGAWWDNLSWHIRREHHMTSAEYKDKVGLLRSSCLLSESARAKLLRNIEVRKKNLVVGRKKTEEQIAKIKETFRRTALSREYQNRRGTCPAQLIERLRKQAKETGRIPTTQTTPYYETLVHVFGSFNNAMERAGFIALKVGQNRYHATKSDMERDDLIQELRNFKEAHGRYPTSSDCKRKILTGDSVYRRIFGSFRQGLEAAFKELEPVK